MLYAAKFGGSRGGIEASPSRFASAFGGGAIAGGAGAVIAVMSAAVAAAGLVFEVASIVLSVATAGGRISAAFWIGCGSSFVTRPVCLSDAKKIRFPSGLNQASVSF